MIILHLKTQRDQPYGSERRCCERCGLMLWPQMAPIPEGHVWTDDEREYDSPPPDHVNCRSARVQKQE